MGPTFFENQKKFRTWLVKHHLHETELLVGFYKVKSKIASMSWSESVDQALCFGWIDGVRKSIDQDSYTIRFTPRKKNSIWSIVNINKVEALTKAGLMTDQGLKAFDLRTEPRSGIYSHENEAVQLRSEYERLFKTKPLAWNYFTQQPASYQKVTIHWIMSAKQEKTRISRLEKAIHYSDQQKRML